MHNQIRGEYWIVDGRAEYADGDVGEQNHDMIAHQHIESQYADEIVELAQELNVPIDRHDPDVQKVMSELLDALTQDQIIQKLGINKQLLNILSGSGDPSKYVMINEGWIAIRSMNIDLYGYDDEKRKSLAQGLPEILENEGIEDDVPAEEIEFTLYDQKNLKSRYITLAEIENTQQPRLASQAPIEVGYAPKLQKFGNFQRPDTTENRPTSQKAIKPTTYSKAAQQAKIVPPGHELWRGTSEHKLHFKEWLLENNVWE